MGSLAQALFLWLCWSLVSQEVVNLKDEPTHIHPGLNVHDHLSRSVIGSDLSKQVLYLMSKAG